MPGFARWRVRATKSGQEREPAEIVASGINDSGIVPTAVELLIGGLLSHLFVSLLEVGFDVWVSKSETSVPQMPDCTVVFYEFNGVSRP